VHLLIIEDDERLGRVLKRLLEEDRHVVDVATDGESGLNLAEVDGIDVVILDVGLPDISGLEVARRLRKGGSEVSILMLTARDTVNDRVAGLSRGSRSGRSRSTRPPVGSPSPAGPSTSARASSRSSSASSATRARRSAAISSSTRPGHSPLR
jgi:CheY-like chemotaxis protein